MAHDLSSPAAAERASAAGLAPYAAWPQQSRGRLLAEPQSASRSPHQRDRDRIVHCTAFRRLTYKTQVFVYHEGDHYRSRLTHSLEVAQIARSIARTLRLNEDLAEAIALAHDLGHTPFGHAGERALNEAMAPFGGFDHNAQSLRIVTRLERRYAAFDGLNLTWETLEGLVKHNGPLLDSAGRAAGKYAEGEVPAVVLDYAASHDLELASQPSAEAQVAALADDIAYNNHDIDDGFRAGLCRLEDLRTLPLTGGMLDEINELYPSLEPVRLIYELNRRLITAMVDDAVGEARGRLASLAPESAGEVRGAAAPVVAFSEPMQGACDALRRLLTARVYRDQRVTRVMDQAQHLVADLFERYMSDAAALPPEWRPPAGPSGERQRARRVADFIAGMTDRFAHTEHRRLFDATPDLR